MARARTNPLPTQRAPAAWMRRFALAASWWLVPATLAWLLLTPWYNRALAGSAEQLLHLFESPDQSRLHLKATHFLTLTRGDFRGGQAVAGEFKLSDSHFNWILLTALFMAVPDLPWRARLRKLAGAAAILVVFHVLLVVFHVQFFPATQLGEWSLRNFGPAARNFFGLGKHLLDLPIKLGLPLALWAGFHWRSVRPADRPHP